MNHISLERTLHPVGQGTFFTECFSDSNGMDFNVVYDCGTNSHKKGLVQAISYTFPQGKQVDVIFISHLDKDHVNGVKDLAKNCNLTSRTLFVMPLFCQAVYVLAYLRYGASFIQIFRTISKAGCKVAFVEPMNSQEGNDGESIDLQENRILGEEEDVVRIGGITVKGAKIKSGMRLRYHAIWEYVPYNPSGADAVLFNKEIVRKHIQLDLLLNALGKTRPTVAEKQELKKVKDIYRQVTHRVGKDSNKLNICGLVLLSHKKSITTKVTSKFYYPYRWRFEYVYPCYRWNSELSACLYTGDMDFSSTTVYQKLMDEVMRCQSGEHLQLLQIPHHGSQNNYCLALCVDKRYDIAFTNFGVHYHQSIFDPRLFMEYWRQLRTLLLITEYHQAEFKMQITLS